MIQGDFVRRIETSSGQQLLACNQCGKCSAGCPVAFDGNAYANDPSGQFLNVALGNNPTIPFPDKGLGAVLYYNPLEWWYVSGGIVDVLADARESGFTTALHDEDFFFYVFETGVTPQFDSDNGPLQGAYRIGLWIDGQDKARISNGHHAGWVPNSTT